MPYVSVQRQTIYRDLLRYGEDEVAAKVNDMSEGQRVAIGWATGRYWDGPENMQLRRAVATAAVEVLEGQPRPLKRKRARPGSGP